MEIICQNHPEKDLYPLMVDTGISPLGNRRFICAVCSRIKEVGTGKLLKGLGKTYIDNGRQTIPCHVNAFSQQPHGCYINFQLLFHNSGVEAIEL